ncbi:MAG: DUF917 domain-containing protein [Chloroflexi bacterium]|nr:DUF917 domain-containing protein [Chloroflexota bacterium]
MGKFTLHNRQDVEDFVRGCTFYGTGGGGAYDRGVDLLMDQLKKGHEVGWVTMDEMKDDDHSCCPFLMGSLAGPDARAREEMKVIYGLGDIVYDETARMVGAIKGLEAKQKQKVNALVPIELGGANSAACVCTAAELGIISLDGDYTGRAIPEIQQTTPFIFEHSLMPIVSCDGWGNIATIESAVNWRMAERLGKQISVAGYSYSSQAGFFANATDTKKALIPGTMTECYQVGKTLREAVEQGKDPADTIAAKLDGHVICKGKVTSKTVEDRDDYYWATHEITGLGDYKGTQLKVWLKNENHMCWKNGEIFVTSPDMIQIIDTKTGQPYTNNVIKVGMEVSVIAMKARDIFRTERGLLALSPKAFGFDMEYVPFEERL